MSKLIKPSDKELFESARKFEKKPLSPAQKPAKKESAAVNHAPAPEPDPPRKNNLKPSNPEDMIAQAARKAEQIVRDAESKAEGLLRNAKDKVRQLVREAENLKAQAFEGAREGTREAQHKSEEQLRISSQMVESLVAQIKAQESQLLQMLTPRLANLATELAQKIIHREIEKDPSIVTLQAEEAISRILDREKLIIRVNPGDEELMKSHKKALMTMFDGIDKIEVIGDSKVERGGCIVETHLVKVDAQPCSQLEAARKTLLGEAEK